MNEIYLFVAILVVVLSLWGGINVSIGDINIGNSTKKDDT